MMKATSKKIMTGALTVLSLALTNAAWADDEQPKAPSKAYPDNPGQSDTSMSGGAPTEVNKASGLIGMSVRNQNDEHLGKIKDLVFDLKTERVAYVVMAASGTGTLGMHEHLLAVPLSAFTASADNKYLTLRADKSKIETAAGIDRKAWPSATNPSWGAEPFWQSGADKPASQTKPDETPRQNTPKRDKQPDNSTPSAQP